MEWRSLGVRSALNREKRATSANPCAFGLHFGPPGSTAAAQSRPAEPIGLQLQGLSVLRSRPALPTNSRLQNKGRLVVNCPGGANLGSTVSTQVTTYYPILADVFYSTW